MVADLMKEGKVKSVIEKVYELKDAGDPFGRLRSGRTRGKLVIRVANSSTSG